MKSLNVIRIRPQQYVTIMLLTWQMTAVAQDSEVSAEIASKPRLQMEEIVVEGRLRNAAAQLVD